jgi:pilus assembly protein Flp/PilA
VPSLYWAYNFYEKFIVSTHYPVDGMICREAAMLGKLLAFAKCELGATSIEYGIIASGVALAVIAVVNGLGTRLNTKFTSISTQLH